MRRQIRLRRGGSVSLEVETSEARSFGGRRSRESG
jgi:hypothetical protein